jgi:hypothetical protein
MLDQVVELCIQCNLTSAALLVRIREMQHCTLLLHALFWCRPVLRQQNDEDVLRWV